jgi:predicted site-specific integrase-resolvase
MPSRKIEERLVSRRELSERWGVSTETIKRRTREGLLKPVRFNQRLLRYRLSDIICIEQEAGTQP